jgi:hypothetical protein
MANKKISELQIEVNPQVSDLIVMASDGTSKRTTLGSVVNAELPATFGDTSINGDLNVNGNINVSTIISSSTLYKSGSTRLGNTTDDRHIFTGSVYISGITEFGGNLIPKNARGATLGTSEKPFSEIFVSSGSLYIASDDPSAPGTSLSNIDGKIEISAGGIQLLGGGVFNGATGSFRHLSGSVTQNGDVDIYGNTTITGSLGISGNINGAPNLVTTASFNSYTASQSSLTYVTNTSFNSYTASQSPLAYLSSANNVLINSPTPIIVTGMSASPNMGTYIVNFNSEFTVDDTSSQTLQASIDLQALYAELIAIPATVTGHAATYGSETLTAGVYTQAGAATITGTLTLDGGGNSNSLFVFRNAGAFSTGASANVLLINGAQSNNVWFVSEGASSTGASAIISGSMLSNQAAVSTGAGTRIQGRILAINGAAGLGAASIVTAPVGTSVSTLGSLDVFNIFCGAGSVSNTGASEIELSIGTNNGTITGFATATVGGSIVPSGAGTLSKFRCGVYVDGNIVQNSLRSATKPFEAETFEFPIVLQTVTTISEGQTIDIRGYSELGTQTIGPRMSLVLTPIMGGLPE